MDLLNSVTVKKILYERARLYTEMLRLPQTSQTVPLGYYFFRVSRELQVLTLMSHSSYQSHSAAWPAGKLCRW